MSHPTGRASRPSGPFAIDGANLSDVRRRLRWLTAGRLFVVSLLLGGTLLVAVPTRGVDSFTPRLLLSLIAVTYALSLLFAAWLGRIRRPTAAATAQLAWDVCLTTGLVYVSGGLASGFTFLYGVIILMGAIVVGVRAAQATTVACLVAYTVLGIAVSNGWFPHPPDQPAQGYRLSDNAAGLALMTNIVGLLLVGTLANHLADRLSRAGGELRRATQNVASLARLNADIVRSLTSGLLTTDLNRQVATVNPAGAALFEAEPQHVIGRPIDDFLPLPETQPDDLGTRLEGKGRRIGGARFPVGFTYNPLRDAEGSVIGTVVTFQDLTEIRELREAASRAERLAALGRLAAGLAHEIRNPLSSISGSVELVRESEALAAEDRRLLGIVVHEVERLDDLVTTMLHVGRPKPPHRARHNLVALVESVAKVAEKGLAQNGQARIQRALSDEPVWASVDSGQIRQVVWNLLKNAVQVSPAGGVVELGVEVREQQAMVQVRDQGPGISEEVRARLFETFFSQRPHGVGLGLALVKQIVDAHDGSIDVESTPGAGATFRVGLPLSP